MYKMNALLDKNTKKAGVVVLKEAGLDFLILGLRFGSTFDLPKGGIEPYESALDAALRETAEETSITKLDFRWGLQKAEISNVTLFIATTDQEPIIRRNPETGEFEHQSAAWLTLEQAEASLHTNLRLVVPWVKEILGVK